ncbi:hypothetical protein ACJJTC_000489 [Scirpophaga incertulas]
MSSDGGQTLAIPERREDVCRVRLSVSECRVTVVRNRWTDSQSAEQTLPSIDAGVGMSSDGDISYSRSEEDVCRVRLSVSECRVTVVRNRLGLIHRAQSRRCRVIDAGVGMSSDGGQTLAIPERREDVCRVRLSVSECRVTVVRYRSGCSTERRAVICQVRRRPQRVQ